MLNAAPAKHDIFQTFRCQFIAQLHVEMLISKIIESEVEKMGHISARVFHFLTFSDILRHFPDVSVFDFFHRVK